MHHSSRTRDARVSEWTHTSDTCPSHAFSTRGAPPDRLRSSAVPRRSVGVVTVPQLSVGGVLRHPLVCRANFKRTTPLVEKPNGEDVRVPRDPPPTVLSCVTKTVRSLVSSYGNSSNFRSVSMFVRPVMVVKMSSRRTREPRTSTWSVTVAWTGHRRSCVPQRSGRHFNVILARDLRGFAMHFRGDGRRIRRRKRSQQAHTVPLIE